MNKKDAKIFLDALTELEKEKGISKESLLETVEQALLAAYKKHYGDDENNVKVIINRETGNVEVFEVKTVVRQEDLYDPAVEIILEDAHELRKRAKLGDVMEIPVNCEEFRRNAIQNGKQIVIQKVREAERQNVYDKFKCRENDIINGIIRRIDDRRNIFIEFDGVEAMLPITEQSPSDLYRIGDRLKVYVVEVEKTSRFPKILISRKNDGLLRKLFELEVPEIGEGIIELKSVSREAGSRAKVAVYSENSEIDTIGACIGQKGLRIKNIVNELNGEKIDIIEWKESKEEFVSAALSPAKVTSVELLEDEVTARVIVDTSQLSLAIGKNGQNARLAAKLTGMRVDIKTIDAAEAENKAFEEEDKATDAASDAVEVSLDGE